MSVSRFCKADFSSRWYLCAHDSPYALHPGSQEFPQHIIFPHIPLCVNYFHKEQYASFLFLPPPPPPPILLLLKCSQNTATQLGLFFLQKAQTDLKWSASQTMALWTCARSTHHTHTRLSRAHTHTHTRLSLSRAHTHTRFMCTHTRTQFHSLLVSTRKKSSSHPVSWVVVWWFSICFCTLKTQRVSPSSCQFLHSCSSKLSPTPMLPFAQCVHTSLPDSHIKSPIWRGWRLGHWWG